MSPSPVENTKAPTSATTITPISYDARTHENEVVTSSGQKKTHYKTAAVCWVSEVVIGGALMGVALLTSMLLDDIENENVIHFVSLFMVSAIWIIAQYASFTIQLTGHIWPSQHIKSLMNIGPVTVLALAVAGGLTFGWVKAAVDPVKEIMINLKAIEILLIFLPCVLGLAGKTIVKLRYIRDRDDGIQGRAMCPFSTIDTGVFMKEFAPPFLCMIWTLIFAVGLQKFAGAIERPDDENDFGYTCWLFFVYLVVLGCLHVGRVLLERHIWKSATIPSFRYNSSIILVFYFVYTLMIAGQVRLIMVKFTGVARLAVGILHPIHNLVRRILCCKNVVVKNIQVVEELELKNNTDLGSMQLQNVGAFERKAVGSDELKKIPHGTGESNKSYTSNQSHQSTGTATSSGNNRRHSLLGTDAGMNLKQLKDEDVGMSMKNLSEEDRFRYLSAHTAVLYGMLSIYASLITDDVAAGSLSILSCTLGRREEFQLGQCPSVTSVVLTDLLPMYIIDICEIAWMGRKDVPELFFFRKLDWFIVVGAIATTLLNVFLLVWASSF